MLLVQRRPSSNPLAGAIEVEKCAIGTGLTYKGLLPQGNFSQCTVFIEMFFLKVVVVVVRGALTLC